MQNVIVKGTTLFFTGLMLAVLGLPAAAQTAPAATDDNMFRPYLADRDFAGAWQNYRGGQYDVAYAAFARLFREHPESEAINFAYALAAARVGKRSQAAMALDRVLLINPRNTRARLELGRVYYEMGQNALAREQFEQVLATQPPPAVADNVRKYLDQIKDAERAWQVMAMLGVGILYDDNVNIGPRVDSVTIDPIHQGDLWIDTLQVDPETQAKKAFGVYGSAAVSGTYDIGQRGAWSMMGAANIYRNRYDGEHQYEIGLLDVALGPQYGDSVRLLQLPLQAERINRGSEGLVNLAGFNPSYLYAWSPDLLLITTAVGEYRDYVDVTDRDGWFYNVGEMARFLFGQDRHAVNARLRLFSEDTRAKEYANQGFEGSLGIEYRALAHTILQLMGQGRGSWYDTKEALAPEQRRDTQWSAIAGLTQELSSLWGVSLNYQYIHNHSTFDLYSYNRNIVNLSTYRMF